MRATPVSLLLAALLALAFVLPAVADDEAPGAPPVAAPAPADPADVPKSPKPAAKGPTPAALAQLILEGGELERAFVAQHLSMADPATVRAVHDAIREAVGAPDKDLFGEAEPGDEQRIIQLETRIIEAEPNFLADIGADGEPLAGRDGAPAGVSFLDDTQLEVILRAVERSERLRLISAPRISTYSGQQAHVSLVNQTSYVRDYDVRVGDGMRVADPIVDTVQDGLLMQLRGTLSKDGRFVGIELGLTQATLATPIAERQLVLGEGMSPVRIQVPSVRLDARRASVKVPDGATTLVSLGDTGGEGRARFVLVTATRLEMEGPLGPPLPAPEEPKKGDK